MSHHATVARRSPAGSRPLFVALVLTVGVALAPFATPTARASDDTWSSPTSTTGPASPSLAGTDVHETTVSTAPEVDGPTGVGPGGRSTWNIVAEPGARLVCRLLTDGAADEPFSCSSPVELTLANDGTYVLRVSQTGAAGDESFTTDSTPYTVTAQAVASPVVSGPRGPAPLRSPVWDVQTGAVEGTRCRLLLHGATVGEVQPCGPTVSFALASDGSYVVEAVETDGSGRMSEVGTSLPYELDTTPPATPTVFGPAGQDNDPQPSWTFGDAEPGTHPVCTLRGPDESTAPVVCGPEGVTLEPLVLDGAYRLDVVHTDAAGNRSLQASLAYVLDTTPPVPPTFRVEPTGPSLSPRVEWRLAPDPQAATVVCTLWKDKAPIDTRGCDDTSYTRDLTALGAGVFMLAVSAIDDLGNTSAASMSRPYTYSLPAPGPLVWDSYPGSTLAVPLAEPAQTGSPGYAPKATPFLFHGEEDATFHCVLARGPEQDAADPVAARGCDGPVPGTGRFVLDDLSTAVGGTYWLTVTGSRPGQGAGVSVMSFVLDVTVSGAPVFTRHVLVRAEALPVAGASPTTLTTLGTGYLPDGPPVPGEAVAPPGPAPLAQRPVLVLQPELADAAPVTLGPVEPAEVSQEAALAAPSLPERLRVPGVPGAMHRALPELVAESVTRPTVPLALGTMMLLFLLLQNRIDRRDPKLCAAPSDLEPDLAFGPTLRAASDASTQVPQAEPRPR